MTDTHEMSTTQLLRDYQGAHADFEFWQRMTHVIQETMLEGQPSDASWHKRVHKTLRRLQDNMDFCYLIMGAVRRHLEARGEPVDQLPDLPDYEPNQRRITTVMARSRNVTG